MGKAQKGVIQWHFRVQGKDQWKGHQLAATLPSMLAPGVSPTPLHPALPWSKWCREG